MDPERPLFSSKDSAEHRRSLRGIKILNLERCVQTKASVDTFPEYLLILFFQSLRQALALPPERQHPDYCAWLDLKSEVGGSKGSSPCNQEIVSFRACARRAVSGCEEQLECKRDAGALSLFLFRPGRLSLFPFGEGVSLFP